MSVQPTAVTENCTAWKYVDYHRIYTVAQSVPIKFEIPAAGEEYLDLCNSVLYIRLKVVQPNGNNLANDAKVAPVNLFQQSLFSQVDVSLNGKLVTTASDTYGYRAYIETLLSYGEDAKKMQLTSNLFHKDEPGKFDNMVLQAADNVEPNPAFV